MKSLRYTDLIEPFLKFQSFKSLTHNLSLHSTTLPTLLSSLNIHLLNTIMFETMCGYGEERKQSILNLLARRQTCSWVMLENCDSNVNGEFRGRLANLSILGASFTEKGSHEQGARDGFCWMRSCAKIWS